MADWPTELQQEPNTAGFSMVVKPNAIRSAMAYGPDKIRKRTTADWYNVTIQLWCDYAQLAVLDQFYIDNVALTFNWLDFSKSPAVSAVYRFVNPPQVTPLNSHSHWQVSLALEMERG